jgi:predicted nucleic acid-binding protein
MTCFSRIHSKASYAIRRQPLHSFADDGCHSGHFSSQLSGSDWRSRTTSAALRNELDAGERAAIQLAQLEEESLLVMDDATGRREAQLLGLPNIGTLGVLRLAAIEGLVHLPTVLDKLMRTNFRAPAVLIQQLIAEDHTRRFAQ